ncbi:hypothetical protein L0Y59_02110 [Candidatus Uhrbacteria bacterium]|nr:hypothetical protein [Candidatus Uhrbacteria bacterium]
MRQDRKDPDIAEAVDTVEFALAVYKALVLAVKTKDGAIRHLRRVVEEPALRASIADLIVPPGTGASETLREGEFLVHVGYDMPNDREALENVFSYGNVSGAFIGEQRWEFHPLCADVVPAPAGKIFLEKTYNRSMKSDEAIAAMDKLGYRPATHLEAYAYAVAFPEDRFNARCIALGSYVQDRRGRRVAVLDGRPCSLNLQPRGYARFRVLDQRYDDDWSAGDRLLFIRKES